jgi:hypothetical protein
MFARVKVQTLRTMLWLGNAVVILAIVGLLAVIVINFKKKKGDFAPFDTNRLKKELQKGPSIDVDKDDGGRGQFNKYTSVWDLNITGREEAVAKVDDTPKDVVSAVPAIAEELGIEMVVSAAESTRRMVELRYKKLEAALPTPTSGAPNARGASAPVSGPGATAGATAPNERSVAKTSFRLLREGDVLQDPYDKAPYNAKVVQIASDEVIFSWGGKEEALPVPKLTDVPMSKPKVQPSVPGLPNARTDDEATADETPSDEPPIDPTESRKIDENTWFIGTKERDRIKADYETLWSEVTWSLERHKEDRRQYLKVAKIPEGSLAKERGLEEGDLLRAINGRTVVNKSSVFQYFEENPNYRTYRVELERRGKRFTRIFQVAD